MGTIDLYLAYLDNLESVEPPPGMASEHQAYVLATRDLVTTIREAMAGFTTLSEFEGYYFEDFFSSPKITGNHQDALYKMGAACQSLQKRLTEGGHNVFDESPGADLACPPASLIEEFTTTPTTLQPGLAGEFAACMREVGYEVFDVDIVETEEGPVASGFGTNDNVPEEAVRSCEQGLGTP